MLVYLAFSENYSHLLQQERARIIISYGRKHGSSLDVYLPPGFDDYMLDSGGYQLAVKTQERQVFLKAYTLWVNFILEKYKDKVKSYMGLDTQSWTESLRNYDYMKSEGLNPVPVWKAFWPEALLDALCEEYDYVAIGGIAFGASKKVLRSIFERVKMSHPETKLHLLGVGIRGGVAFKTFRPYSVDVSTWSVPARFGHDIILDKKQVLKEVKLPDADRERLRKDSAYLESMLTKSIRLMQSLETELDKLDEPYQQQMSLVT